MDIKRFNEKDSSDNYKNRREYVIFSSIDQFRNTIVKSEVNQGKKTIYYFDNNGLYQSKNITSIKIENTYVDHYLSPLANCTVKCRDNEILSLNIYIYCNKTPKLPKVIGNVVMQLNWMYIIFGTMRPGEDKLQDFVERYNYMVDHKDHENKVSSEVLYKKYPKIKDRLSISNKILRDSDIPEVVKKFVYKIDRPVYEKETGNTKENTFDFIRVFIAIPSKDTMPGRLDFVKQHKNEIAGLVVERINKDSSFKKYNIPVNFLKLENMTLTHTSELMLLFGLKDID